jgi:hypothetical protein
LRCPLALALALVLSLGGAGCTGMVPDRGASPAPGAAPDAAIPHDTAAALDTAAPDTPKDDDGATATPPPSGGGDAPAAASDSLDGAAGDGGALPPGPYARGLRISLLEASQGVFVKLASDGKAVPVDDRNAPLIEGRPLFFRLHVATGAGFVDRPMRAVLALESADGTRRQLVDEKTIAGSSTVGSLEGTFNFLCPAEAVTPGLRVSAAVYESLSSTDPEPPATAAPRFPGADDAGLDLAVKAGKMELDLVLVPAIGEGGALMDSPERRQRIERYLFDVYPIQKLNATWRQPLRFPTRVGYPAALMALAQARMADDAPPGTYYHLLLAVEDSTETYLGIGNFAGTTAADAARRIAVTFVRERSIDSELDTISHEMGHNHGQKHVPGCMATGVDTAYPYPNTGVGVNGHSLSEGTLMLATKYKDYMGYCYPTWISDYTWRAFERRVRLVSAFPAAGKTDPLAERSLQGFAAPAGPPAWGVVTGDLVPPGARATPPRHAEILLDDGRHLTAPVAVQALGDGDHQGREIAVRLPTLGEIARVTVVVDGQRYDVERP